MFYRRTREGQTEHTLDQSHNDDFGGERDYWAEGSMSMAVKRREIVTA